jgi:hypothetical protein
VRTRWLAPDAASHDDSAACVHKAQSAQAPARGADPPDAEAQDGKWTMSNPRSDAGRRMILEDSFLLLASGGLLLLIVLAEPWLLALAVQVGVVLGGLYLLVRFAKAAWRD